MADDYDFILIDTGPHLDPFLLNGLAASDLILTPTPPAQVDFHSTLKYLTRLPEMLETLEEEGIEPRLAASIGFMSKMTGKPDHLVSHSLAREVYTSSILDSSCPARMALNVAEKRLIRLLVPTQHLIPVATTR